MKHLILSLTLVFTFLVVSRVRAQEGFNPQSPPPPPTQYAPPPPPASPPPAYVPQQQYPPPPPSYSPAPDGSSQPYPQNVPPPPPTQPYAPPPYYGPPAQPPAVIYAPPPGPILVPPPVLPPLPQSRWNISVDALWLERTVGSSVQLGTATVQTGPFAGSTADQLYSDDQFFPLEAGVRFQVAGWLSDRTAIEASYWGLQQWSVGRSFTGELSDDVLASTPFLQISKTNPDLNDNLGYTYGSRVDNAEINQRIKFNSYSPWWNWSWLWGVRYFRLSDNFTLYGSDTDFHNSESLNYQTANNLVAGQLGLTWLWGWRRFQFTTEGKVALGANIYTAQGADAVSGLNASHDGSDFSALFEVSVLARYRINEVLWLRLGYQYYCMTGLALAPRQLAGWDRNGTVGLDGLSLGLEAAW
jgi:hypothetical protein